MWRIDILSSFTAIAIIGFGVLISIYSLKSMKGKPSLIQYYLYIVLTVLASIGVVFTNNLLVLLMLWGFLGITLYLLINMGDKDSHVTAKKTLIIIGGSDSLMILGVGIVYSLCNTLQMDAIRIEPSGLALLAFILLAIAAFAKAGAMPFHTWIPDAAEHAPVSVSALLPASLDKLLGIYLLFRISTEMFILSEAMKLFLLITGAVTIIAAVMMALIQHDYKKLLGYHAVSQVGYMVLGIGTGNPIGIAGGLFHMINHAMYKSCLFLTSGAVEEKRQTTDLDKLGGLAKVMPITFLCALICSLSISGIPPFNGFVSKWMIYQGLIDQIGAASNLLRITTIICLISAMFGSALTLASFLKLLHATYLGQSSKASKTKDEVGFLMWVPMLILAVLCVVFGVFAVQLPLKYYILPSVGRVDFIGTWTSGLATVLILVGIVVGLIILWIGNLKKNARVDSSYVGGEPYSQASRPSGTEFYNTVHDMGIFKFMYKKATAGWFDIYEVGRKFTFGLSKVFQYLHNGVLPTYLVWCLLGMIVFFIFLGVCN